MKKMNAILASLLMSMTIVSGTVSNDIHAAAYTRTTKDGFVTVTFEEPEPQTEADDTSSSYTRTSYGAYKSTSDDRLAVHGHSDTSLFTQKGHALKLNKSYGDMFTVTKNLTYCLYGFDDQAVAGLGVDNSMIHYAGYDGFTAKIKDNRTLIVTGSKACTDLCITYEDWSEPMYVTDTLSDGRLCMEADLWDSSFKNGLYKISGSIKDDDTIYDLDVCLMVNCASDDPEDYEFYLCYYERHSFSENFSKKVSQRHDDLLALLEKEGVTPQKALNTNYKYPCMATPGVNDDVQYWVDLSGEILEGTARCSDALRALKLHDWITSHLKYDYYKVNVLRVPRYYQNAPAIDTSQLVSRSYTGVCLDFSQIYAIMCREAGIPCVVLSNDTHAWNAIYIEDLGDWFEVDLTVDVNRCVYTEDVNAVTGSYYYFYHGFMTPMVNSSTALRATQFCW